MKGIEQQWVTSHVVHNGNVVRKSKQPDNGNGKAKAKPKVKPTDNSEHVALF